MAGLTFVNQVGAVEGMNQAAPGTLIPESFVRWSQDVLFDRAGLMRRRGPFEKFKMYNNDGTENTDGLFTHAISGVDDERVLAVLSTYDPTGAERIGMVVDSYDRATNTRESILRVFDNTFKYLGYEVLPFDITPLSIVSAKPALGGGLWVSFIDDPSDADTHYQFFWRGGYNSVKKAPFTVTNKVLTTNVATLTIGTHDLIVGQSITVAGVDATFNGTYTITNVTSTTISYAKTASNVTSTSATGTVTLICTGTFTTEAVTNVSTEHVGIDEHITLNTTNNLSAGQFVYATYGSPTAYDYYIGTVKSITGSVVELEKRPFIWESNITNNHGAFAVNTIATSGGGGAVTWDSGTKVCTITTVNAMLYEVGDRVKITVTSGSTVLNGNTYDVTAINTAPAVGSQTFSFISPTNPGNPLGTVDMDESLDVINLTSVPLKFISVRPYTHVHGRGLLTIDDADNHTILSGTAGTSADGHWQAAAVTNYNLYRASDNFYLGKVRTVTSNDGATLWSDTGIKLEGEEYVMRSNDATDLTNDYCVGSSTNTPYNFAGLYTAVYAGYQWFGNFGQDDENTNRVVFSAAHDREAVDLSRDAADSIIFPGKSKFRGLGASSAGLLVFLEDRTYILRGNDRTNFSVEQLVPEGCLCASSIVEYGGGVFWAGKSGIMFFDGASIRNLTKDNLGLYYTDALDSFNPDQDRVLGFMHKNNLIMHYTSWKSPFDPVRYEPIYAADWQNTDGIADRAWDEFDPDFDYDDFFTENNTPIFWDRKVLNNPEESASTGQGITWGNGFYAKEVVGTTVPTTFTANYIYMPGLSASVRFKMWNGSSYTTVTPVTASGITPATKLYVYTGTAYSSATKIIWDGSDWASSAGTGIVWETSSTINKWGPLRKNTSILFSIYMPTNAITTLSNLDFRGVTSIETLYGLKTIVGVNSVETISNDTKYRARLIDIHPVFDTNTNGDDALLVEKINIPTADLVLGPDFYLQTKHFTVGDPILRKWFQRIMLSMLLYDGAIRMDLVDDDDNDSVDINKKKHKYWEIFTEKGYDWAYLTDIQLPKLVSPNKASWLNVEGTVTDWDELFTADFNRYSKRISWRKPSVGFRLYQLNDYKKPYNGVVTRPYRVEVQGFSIGFKPLRQGRI